jgi:hypothetical protein
LRQIRLRFASNPSEVCVLLSVISTVFAGVKRKKKKYKKEEKKEKKKTEKTKNFPEPPRGS